MMRIACWDERMVIEVIYCRHCASDDIVKNGFAPNNGKQKYLCHACGRQSREDPSPNGYAEERKEEILRSYQERSSLRGRLWGEVPERYKKATCYSDFWEAYQGVIPQEQHEANGARKKARPATSSDGSTPFDSGFRASSERRSRSPSRARCTIAA